MSSVQRTLDVLVDACDQVSSAAMPVVQQANEFSQYVSSLSTDDVGVQVAILTGAATGALGLSALAGRSLEYLGRCCAKAERLRSLYDRGAIDERPYILNAQRLYDEHEDLL